MLKTLQIGMNRFQEKPGGLSRYFDDLITALDREGSKTRAIVCASPGMTDTIYRSIGALDAPLPTRLLGARREMRAALKTFHPDVVAGHFALYVRPALDIIGSRPLVAHFHGPWADESAVEGASRLKQRIQYSIEKSVYDRATRCIVLSSAFAVLLEERYGVPADKIRVIPGSIDIDRFDVALSTADARARLGWPQDARIILVVRRLVKRMGIENLIQAISVLRESHPDLRLMIAGRGPLEQALRQQIAQLGLNDCIQMVGFVPDQDLPVAYRAADLSLVPSVALEGFGLIAAESLAAGTPVLVTPVGGLPEVVSGLSKNMILSGFEAEDIVKGLRRALDQRENLPSARQCFAYARAQFDPGVVARKVLDVYREAAS